jgi:hypothetical protein
VNLNSPFVERPPEPASASGSAALTPVTMLGWMLQVIADQQVELERLRRDSEILSTWLNSYGGNAILIREDQQ